MNISKSLKSLANRKGINKNLPKDILNKALSQLPTRIYGKLALRFPWIEAAKFMDTNDYEEWYYNRPRAKRYLNDEKIWMGLADRIQYFKPSQVFEFGSGLGNFLKEAKKRGIDIIGSETSEYAIQNSLCKGKVVKIGQIPKSKLPFKDNSFDLVFSTEVMEHVKETDTEAVIRELNRVCSNYALLTINTFDYTQPGHINIHPREWWKKNFEENGFEHDDKIWNDLNKNKYVNWDIFVFKKVNIMEATKE